MEGWIARSAVGLVPRARLRELSRRSNLRGALQTLSVLGALAISTAVLALAAPRAALPLWAVALVGAFLSQGVLLNCLYAGQHELSHWTVFEAKPLNDLVGHLFGALTLNPFLTDRWMHFAHHRATQDPARDPELMGMAPYDRSSYLWDLVGGGFWIRRVKAILGAAAGRGLEEAWWLDARQRRIVIWEARAHLALWAIAATGSAALGTWDAALFWAGPLLVTKGIHQLQNTGEHTAMPHAPDIFACTRTLLGPAPVNWLFWNMGYHAAHHAFPGVPFHALPRLHAEILSRRQEPVTSLGYIEAQKAIFAAL